MARLPALPSLEIIRGFKGSIDFAVWKGLPYARSWPRYRPAQRSAAAIASAIVFGQIVRAYSLLASSILTLYQEAAKDQPRTARDIMVSGVLGHLHEASMSDFLDLLTECRNSLVNLEGLLNALDSVSTDEIDVNVERSVLPAGAATSAHQVTQNSALATIESLADALDSIGTDELVVKGEDQLFSLKEKLSIRINLASTGAAAEVLDTGTVPAGKYWIVTSASMRNETGIGTNSYLSSREDNETYDLLHVSAMTQNNSLDWSGRIVLEEDDFMRARFGGTALNDVLVFVVHGYKMTRET